MEKIQELGASAEDILQVEFAYACSGEHTYPYKPVNEAETANMQLLYDKGYDNARQCWPLCTFYKSGEEPKHPVERSFCIDGVSGPMLDAEDNIVQDSTVETLKRKLLVHGFRLKCAKERTLKAKALKEVWGLIDCEKLMGPADWNKVKLAKGSKWKCPDCVSAWKRSKSGTRIVKCTNNRGLCFMLTLEEPPDILLNAWKKERIEYYKRFEPFGALLNKGVSLPPSMDFSNIIDLRGETSIAFWTSLLGTPSALSIRCTAAEYYDEGEPE